MDESKVGPLIEAMSADQQADLFREIPQHERARLLATLGEPTQAALKKLLQFNPDTAAGIMTTEFLSVPSTNTVEETLALIARIAREKETVYAIYVLDPATNALVHVVSLRELLTAPKGEAVINVGKRREPLTVAPGTDREDVARLVSRYNLLAVPVVDAEKNVLGIVTVDDIIDTLVEEQTEDVQRFGGMEALDAPYMRIGLAGMIRKRAGWLCALFLSEMLTATAMQHFNNEIAKATVLAMFIPLVMSSGRKLRLAGDVADHSRSGASRSEAGRLVAHRDAGASDRTRAGRDTRCHRLRPHHPVAAHPLLRLRAPLPARRADNRVGARGHRCVRVACRLDAAVSPEAGGL